MPVFVHKIKVIFLQIKTEIRRNYGARHVFTYKMISLLKYMKKTGGEKGGEKRRKSKILMINAKMYMRSNIKATLIEFLIKI